MRKLDERFIATVLAYHAKEGRDHLPWRKTTNPYNILVSEVMLQQTQVDRVIPKYRAFIKQFPSTKQLAGASLAAVLTAWQGLGYNRRAKLLFECARVVSREYSGRWPKSYSDLRALPGVGHYTAAAVLAFAYNEAVPLIETNVRTVYLHHFFADATDVSDSEILTLVERHLPHVGDARTWYAALMDYGSYLKKAHGNPNRRATSYVKQSTFKGSDREVRGALVRALTTRSYTARALRKAISFAPKEQYDTQLKTLLAEGLIMKHGNQYRLPE